MAFKYKWLALKLTALAEVNLKNGVTKLPTEAELCRRYRVSRQTVRQALALLSEQGIISRRQGSGTYLTGRFAAPSDNLVEILVTNDQDYLYPQILHDIREHLFENGFSTHVFLTENRLFAEREILTRLLSSPPRGLLAEACKSALPSPNADLYRALVKKGTALVFLFSPCAGLSEIPYVKDDNSGGSAILVRHLISQGHQAIAGIFNRDDIQGIERFAGFAETMAEFDLPLPDERIGWYGASELSRLQKQDTGFLDTLARETLKDCTAVVCYNDVLAYHLIHTLSRHGLRLPEEMAIAAFDNTYLSSQEYLPFTTLTHAPHEMGRRAAELMLKQLKGLPAQSQEVPWEILIRQSTQNAL